MREEAADMGRVEGVRERGLPRDWRATFLTVGAVVVGLLLAYGQTFWSMVSIWTRSETFAHGYFILPISLYVAWTERDRILRASPRPIAWPLALVPFLGLGWLAANVASVLVVEQYLAVAMLVVSIVAVLGTEASRRLAFPLGFLLLAVPVGEALIPHLITGTTAFTVAALRLSGVPLLQEGNQLTLPNGVWSVVEACSGLRYLIACVTIGLPFAYLTYTSWKRRAAFVAASVLVPIVANWIRAYLVVMLGYLTDMRHGTDIDHIIYGWVFYAFVMFLLLWVGSRFREDAAMPDPASESAARGSFSLARSAVVGAAALALAGLFPLWSVVAASGDPVIVSSFALPESLGSWTSRGAPLAYAPVYVGADVQVKKGYESSEGSVGLHVALYSDDREGPELVASGNQLLPPDGPLWREVTWGSFTSEGLTVDERVASGQGEKLLIWHWYWVGGEVTSSPAWAKILESKRKLTGQPTPSAGIVVFTPVGSDLQAARSRLTAFVEAASPELEARLERAFE